MKLVANRQLSGHYGTVRPHEEFETTDVIGDELLRAGLVRKPSASDVRYQTKPMRRMESRSVTPETPFRDSYVPDSQSAAVAPGGDQIVSETNVLATPVADPVVRRGRS